MPLKPLKRSFRNAVSQVSRRCKTFTLPHLPSFVAFTICAWSRHTSVGNRTSSIFCRHLLCLLGRLVKFSRKERPDGSLLAFAWSNVATQLNSYPSRYRMAFAFSIFFYPQLHQFALRPTFPFGRAMGLPRFAFEPMMG